MHQMRNIIQLILFVFIVLIAFRIDFHPFKNDDLTNIQQYENTHVVKAEDPLYRKIVDESKKLQEDPQDAYIDRVFKKTPGRNGLVIDIDASYEKMKERGSYHSSLLVRKQTSPNIHLKDLPPSPIYRGHPEKSMVALMINVSWGEEYIPNILRILKEQEVKATFFIEGKWAKENSDLVKMIAEQDHLIGNHAYNHPDMKTLSQDQIYEQIKQTNDILQGIIGETPTLFAPPSGSFTDTVVQIAHQLDMETILWTVDTIDWKNPSVPVMIDRVMRNIHPGAMILMHPTAPVEKGLEEMIIKIKDKKLRLNTVEELLNEDR